uniref:Ig-like domain-containing protein n=1 Tax=Anopheles quadriannulatus TaxID=34691 RepID=A0A182XHY2_ANOQN
MKLPANGVAAIYLLLHCVSGSVLKSSALQSSSPFMSLPRNFWQEISVPYTDLPSDDDEQEDESAESTTHDPYPFFDDANMTANIIDERGQATLDKFYKPGSTIELKCIISRVPQPTSYVTWKHGMRMLNYDTSRGGISVKTDLLPGGAMSRLYIANANRHDTGNYTCALADIAQATVSVHVLNGENPAAMQHGSGPQWQPLTGLIMFVQLLLLCLNTVR